MKYGVILVNTLIFDINNIGSNPVISKILKAYNLTVKIYYS
jgi:hypothetical protein